jgi:pimeloyl-ACP methyl ester carboxylesterase
MKRIMIIIAISIFVILAILLTVFILTRPAGDSPAGDPNWRLIESNECPECVPDDEGVPVKVADSGIAFVRTPDERFENLPGYPFKPNYVEIDGLRLHYIDEGPKEGEVVLMLHGQPSWSYLYRKMIPPIAKDGYRVIAVDLIGMGRSDKPIELGIHTYEQHIKWIKKFINALNLKNITLFCQDWGSLIGLRIAGDDSYLFSRIVVANGTLPIIKKGTNPFRVKNPVKIDCELENFKFGESWFSNIVYSEYREKLPIFIQRIIRVVSFQSWINYALTAPDFAPSKIVEYVTVNTLTDEEAAAYDAPYPSLIYKAAIRTFPSMIAAVEEQNVNAWENLGKFQKPFLFLAGKSDKNLGSEENQNMFIQYIPGAKDQPHERLNAHHFIQEDIGEILADRIIKFVKQNPRK